MSSGIGLDSAMNVAVTGLQVNQESMAIVGDNIANINSEGYVKKIVKTTGNVTNGTALGAKIASVSLQVDNFIQGLMYDQSTIFNEFDTINYFNTEIQQIFGSPDSNDTINVVVDDFFSAMKILSNSPESASMVRDAVFKSESLATSISSLAFNLQNLRYKIDQEIETSVNEINSYLVDIKAIVGAMQGLPEGDITYATLKQERDATAGALSKYFNLKIRDSNHGGFNLNVGTGQSILDTNDYVLSYTSLPSIDSMLNLTAFNPLYIRVVGQEATSVDTQIVSGGLSENVTTTLSDGKIVGLLKVRDQIIPNIVSQLDNLASVIIDRVNALHNLGSGFPPAGSLTGTKQVFSSDIRDWSGAVRIGIVDDNGNYLQRGDGTTFAPLTLDLETLQDSYTNGVVNMQTIANEINEYFYNAPTVSTLSLGNLYDIKMVATQNIASPPDNIFAFDFELSNYSQDSAIFQVTSVTVTDPLATGCTTALPLTYTDAAGVRSRTGQPITVNFTGGSGSPYTVRVAMNVTDPTTGAVSNSVVDFVVNMAPSNLAIKNNRYVASAVNSGTAKITLAGTTQRFMQASFVDSNGSPLQAGSSGYLKLNTTLPGYHIVLDDFTSKDMGIPNLAGLSQVAGTGRGFFHYMGINNLFIDNYDTKNIAVNMKIRDDIIKNPNLLSVGRLHQASKIVTTAPVGVGYASGTLQFYANPQIGDTITINGQVFTYVASSAANNQITIGGTMASTLINTVGMLNATNAYTSGRVDLANYSFDGVNTISIKYNLPGATGNNFTVSGNLSSTGVSLNGGGITITPNGTLFGGTDESITVEKVNWGYEISRGDNQISNQISLLSAQIINFSQVGGIPAESVSISGYAKDIISYAATEAKYAQSAATREQISLDAYKDRFGALSGVNLDEEMIDLVKYQNAYGGSAKLIKAVKELYDLLLSVF